MTAHPSLALAGQLLAGAGLTLAAFVATAQFVGALAAAVPALVVAGLVCYLAGTDLDTDSAPTADELEGSE